MLTNREWQIAGLLAWGASKKEVAGKLIISIRTVENTARNIYEKAQVRSIGQLSAWYFCKRFGISEMQNPLISVLFLFTILTYEARTKALFTKDKTRYAECRYQLKRQDNNAS